MYPQESQLSFMVVRPDSLKGDPVIVHSGYDFHFDAILFTPIESHPPRTPDVLDVFDNVRSPFYCYLTITILLAIIILSVAGLSIRKRFRASQRQMRSVGVAMVDTTAHVIYAAINRVELKVCHSSVKYLWTSVVMSLFIIISGYLWNLMSTDQVVEIPVRQIDFLDDLYSEAFGHRFFTLTTNLFLYETLDTAPQHSKLGRLRKRINQTFTMNWSLGGDHVTEAFDHNQKTKTTSALWRWLFDKAYVRIFCHVDAKEVDKLHVGTEKFAQGLMSSMFSRDINPTLREYVSYRLLTRTELGMATTFIEKIILDALHEYNFETNWKAFKCMNGLRDELDQTVPLLRYSGMRNTLAMVKWCIIISSCVLIFERFKRLYF